ncbi:hypothetical protein O181_011656 [Austropuccinia psidii MF-1]|uniref:Uncharacterized protein n=1 Tax=Austropuccinia psidii MF-1 TaxID=1389203 RepID=A0A9Q3GLJ1_9BASI|nr:hypothetical protein [Austropuccinia psidii MF-1]
MYALDVVAAQSDHNSLQHLPLDEMNKSSALGGVLNSRPGLHSLFDQVQSCVIRDRPWLATPSSVFHPRYTFFHALKLA